jgi:hypothetical protein
VYFSSPSRIGICRPPHHKLKQVAFGCGMIHEIFNSHFCFYLCEQPRFGVRAVRTVVFDRGCSDQINRGLAERGGLAIYFKPPLRQTPSRESRKHHRQPIGLILMFSQLDLPFCSSLGLLEPCSNAYARIAQLSQRIYWSLSCTKIKL